MPLKIHVFIGGAITVPSGIDNYDTVEKYIWFSVYDSVERRTLAPSEYSYSNAHRPSEIDEEYSGPEYANYLVAISGEQLTLRIKQGWNVRFLNLPIGTTYSFEETNIPTGYNFVKAEVSGTRWIADMEDGTDQGSAVPLSSLPANASASNDDTAIDGMIDFANARYSTTYTNRTTALYIPVIKMLRGRDMEAGEFSFVLQPIKTDGTRDDSAKQIILNPAGRANQEVTFNFSLDYSGEVIANAPYHDTEGNAVFYYVVYEESGDATDIIYSDSQYIVKVTLKQEGNGYIATPHYYLYGGEGPIPSEAMNDLPDLTDMTAKTDTPMG
ncbi:MAG: hypothetical protein IKH38_04715 [Clostridia bacterium]|nr:hypothetical protein [Clostridia bacterium]